MFNKGAPFDDANPVPMRQLDASGNAVKTFLDPAGEAISQVTSLRSYFSDDFGGATLDATKWDVYDGGLGAVTQTAGPQAAIGTGTTGITHSVSTSSLTVVMGTTTNAEKWFLSKAMFCCTEDIMMIVQRSQAIAANMIQIGLVEIDAVTGYPLQNGTVASEFTNKGVIEFGQTTGTQSAGLRTIGDNSPAEFAPAATTFAPAAMTTAFETLLQVRAEDIHAQSAVMDSAAARTSNTLRASQQVPNDTRVYKLLMRFKNVSAPGSSTTFTVYRLLVQNHQSVSVSVAEGAGGQTGSQGVSVNIGPLSAGSNTIGLVVPTLSASGVSGGTPALTAYQLSAAATTNANLVATGAHRLAAGQVQNTTASLKYLKLFNKATAPVPGTDTPAFVVAIPANGVVSLTDLAGNGGMSFNLGLGFAITGAWPPLDATAVAAGDVNLQLSYL